MRKNLYIMYAIALLQGMVFYGPVATLYRQARGITVFQITLIEGISLALAILLEIPWGVAADRIGYKKTMVFCCGLYFVSKIVFWKADDFSDFLIERIMLSVVEAGVSGVDSSIIYLSCEGKDSRKAFGIYNSMGMAGLLIAAGVFSLFVQDHYSLAGFLTVVSYGIAVFLSAGLVEVRHRKAEKNRSEPFTAILKQTLHNRTLLLFLAAVALLSETHQTITVFLNQLQYERCGMHSASIGLVYIAVAMLGLLGGYSSAVARRAGERKAILLLGILSALSCLTLALTSRAVPSVMGVMMLRISNTLFQPIQIEIQNRQIRTAHRATALSINSMFVNCIAIGTNLVFGALSDWNLSWAFLFGAGICGVSLILFAEITDIFML